MNVPHSQLLLVLVKQQFRPKPKRKVSNNHESEEVQLQKYATDYMIDMIDKITEQSDMETKKEDDNFCEMIAIKLKKMRQGATKEYLKLEIN